MSNLGLQGAVTSRPAPASTSLMHGARTTTLCVLPLPIRTPYAGGLQGELGCLQRKVGLRALRCGMKAWGLPMLYHGHCDESVGVTYALPWAPQPILLARARIYAREDSEAVPPYVSAQGGRMMVGALVEGACLVLPHACLVLHKKPNSNP